MKKEKYLFRIEIQAVTILDSSSSLLGGESSVSLCFEQGQKLALTSVFATYGSAGEDSVVKVNESLSLVSSISKDDAGANKVKNGKLVLRKREKDGAAAGSGSSSKSIAGFKVLGAIDLPLHKLALSHQAKKLELPLTYRGDSKPVALVDAIFTSRNLGQAFEDDSFSLMSNESNDTSGAADFDDATIESEEGALTASEDKWDSIDAIRKLRATLSGYSDAEVNKASVSVQPSATGAAIASALAVSLTASAAFSKKVHSLYEETETLQSQLADLDAYREATEQLAKENERIRKETLDQQELIDLQEKSLKLLPEYSGNYLHEEYHKRLALIEEQLEAEQDRRRYYQEQLFELSGKSISEAHEDEDEGRGLDETAETERSDSPTPVERRTNDVIKKLKEELVQARVLQKCAVSVCDNLTAAVAIEHSNSGYGGDSDAVKQTILDRLDDIYRQTEMYSEDYAMALTNNNSLKEEKRSLSYQLLLVTQELKDRCGGDLPKIEGFAAWDNSKYAEWERQSSQALMKSAVLTKASAIPDPGTKHVRVVDPRDAQEPVGGLNTEDNDPNTKPITAAYKRVQELEQANRELQRKVLSQESTLAQAEEYVGFQQERIDQVERQLAEAEAAAHEKKAEMKDTSSPRLLKINTGVDAELEREMQELRSECLAMTARETEANKRAASQEEMLRETQTALEMYRSKAEAAAAPTMQDSQGSQLLDQRLHELQIQDEKQKAKIADLRLKLDRGQKYVDNMTGFLNEAQEELAQWRAAGGGRSVSETAEVLVEAAGTHEMLKSAEEKNAQLRKDLSTATDELKALREGAQTTAFESESDPVIAKGGGMKTTPTPEKLGRLPNEQIRTDHVVEINAGGDDDDLDSAKERIQKLEEVVDAYNIRLRNTADIIRGYKDRIYELEAPSESSQKMLAMEGELKAAQERVCELETRMENASKQYRDMRADFAKTRDENHELRSKAEKVELVAAMELDVKTARSEAAALQEALDSSKASEMRLKQHLDEMESDFAGFRSEVAEMEGALEMSKAHAQSLEESLMHERAQGEERLLEVQTELKSALESIVARNEAADSEAKERIAELERENEDRDAEIKALTQSKMQLESELMIATSHAQLQKYDSLLDHSSEKQEMTALSAHNEQLQGKVTLLEGEVADMKAKNETYLAKLFEGKNYVEYLNEEIESLEQEVARARSSGVSDPEGQKRLIDLHDELDRSNKDLAECERQLSDANDIIVEMKVNMQQNMQRKELAELACVESEKTANELQALLEASKAQVESLQSELTVLKKAATAGLKNKHRSGDGSESDDSDDEPFKGLPESPFRAQLSTAYTAMTKKRADGAGGDKKTEKHVTIHESTSSSASALTFEYAQRCQEMQRAMEDSEARREAEVAELRLGVERSLHVIKDYEQKMIEGAEYVTHLQQQLDSANMEIHSLQGKPIRRVAGSPPPVAFASASRSSPPPFIVPSEPDPLLSDNPSGTGSPSTGREKMQREMSDISAASPEVQATSFPLSGTTPAITSGALGEDSDASMVALRNQLAAKDEILGVALSRAHLEECGIQCPHLADGVSGIPDDSLAGKLKRALDRVYQMEVSARQDTSDLEAELRMQRGKLSKLEAHCGDLEAMLDANRMNISAEVARSGKHDVNTKAAIQKQGPRASVEMPGDEELVGVNVNRQVGIPPAVSQPLASSTSSLPAAPSSSGKSTVDIREYNKLAQELKALERRFAQHKSLAQVELDDKNADIAAMRADIARSREIFQSLNAAKTAAEARSSELLAEQAKLVGQLQAHHSTSTRNESQEKRIHQHTQDNVEGTSSSSAFGQRRGSVVTELITSKVALAEMQAERDDPKMLGAGVAESLSPRRQQEREISVLHARVEELTAECAEKAAECEQLVEQLITAKMTIASLQTELDEAKRTPTKQRRSSSVLTDGEAIGRFQDSFDEAQRATDAPATPEQSPLRTFFTFGAMRSPSGAYSGNI